MADSPNVLAFPGAEPLPENPLSIEHHRNHFCTHGKITLDDHQRQVRCVSCGKVFDPYEFLRNEANRLQAAWTSHRTVMAAAHERQASVEALKKEEARLKSRIKTLKEKAEPVIDVRGGKYL